jgi:hypothetical protein
VFALGCGLGCGIGIGLAVGAVLAIKLYQLSGVSIKAKDAMGLVRLARGSGGGGGGGGRAAGS